ncbi:SLOG cluster 4 domain-containing protein [Williamsia sterculiae]|uniref:TIGR00725 family protein n=1 Tax=Williamsia sterculiae TaxID=1344003 RepID=A0A1N7DIZ0_9NOCA|nr:hypothetical protein [Williamsia sterculiae]SIR75792.1 hypothetical protein SAMN05445060_0672 [Williamsia sterculiae]
MSASTPVNPIHVAVVGPGDADDDICLLADQLAQALVTRLSAVIVCGGLSGVMAAAAAGAARVGGVSVGLLPGDDRTGAAPHLSIALPTGLGQLRNGLVVTASDAVVAVGCNWGTLSEVALAARLGRPTFVLNGWSISPPQPGVHRVTGVTEAVDAIRGALGR